MVTSLAWRETYESVWPRHHAVKRDGSGTSLFGRRILREVKTHRDAWLDTAFAMLAEGGVDNVRIEPLARRLRVTKGGFYWHFKDRAELLAAMLEQWRNGRVAVIARHVRPDADETAADVLRRLLARYLDHPNPRGTAIEMAVRDWARHDGAAAEAVEAVDRARLSHVAPLFEALNLEPCEAAARARLFYAYVFGQNLLAPTANADEAARQQARIASILLGGPPPGADPVGGLS